MLTLSKSFLQILTLIVIHFNGYHSVSASSSLSSKSLSSTVLLSSPAANSGQTTPITGQSKEQPFLSKTLKTFENIYYPHKEIIAKYLEQLTSNSDYNLTSSCVHSLLKLKNGLNGNSLWAIKFLDASGRGSGGLLNYYLIDLGNYDECLSLSVLDKNEPDRSFQGQYCLVKLYTPMITKLDLINTRLNGSLLEFFHHSTEEFKLSPPQIGLCIPSTCKPSQLAEAINKNAKENGLTIELGPHCDTIETYNQPYNGIEKFSLIVIGTFISLTVLGTFYEKGWLGHFSANRNINRLVNDTNKSDCRELNYLNGIKFYYLVLSIFGHIWYIMGTLIPPLYMGIFSYSLSESKIIQELSANCLLLIEIMIAVGGFLTMYTCYKVLEQTQGKLSFIQYMVIRYLRTTPTLIASILLVFLWPKLGSGPLFRELAVKQTDNCLNNWWKNLLYINNYQHIFDMCLPSTWYLSSDFQLYAISYLPIILLYRRPKTGLIVCLIYMIGSACYMIFDANRRNLAPIINMRDVSIPTINGISDLYLPFHLHIQSYIMGVLSGYATVTKMKPQIKNFFTLGWTICVSISFSILYFTYRIKFNPNISRSEELLFIGFHRIILIIGFVWTFYAFSFGSAKRFRKLFSWKYFAPISTMSLSIVLVQFVFMFYDLATKRQPLVFTNYNQIIYGLTSLVMCIFLGSLLHIIVEAPTANLLTSILSQPKKPKEQSKVDLAAGDNDIKKTSVVNNNNEEYSNENNTHEKAD